MFGKTTNANIAKTNMLARQTPIAMSNAPVTTISTIVNAIMGTTNLTMKRLAFRSNHQRRLPLQHQFVKMITFVQPTRIV
jgi:hypothetical protein